MLISMTAPNTSPVMPPLAQRQIAWIAVQRKDNPKAEVELTKFLQMDPTQGQFSYFLAQAQFLVGCQVQRTEMARLLGERENCQVGLRTELQTSFYF